MVRTSQPSHISGKIQSKMSRSVIPPMIMTGDERDRRDQLEVERLRGLPASVRARPGQREHQTRTEEPGEQRGEVRETGGAAAGLLADLGPDQRLVGRVHAQGLGRRRHLDQPVESLVQVLAGDRGDDLTDPAVELVLADPAVGVGLLEPVTRRGRAAQG